MEFNLVQTIAIYALPVIFAITLHEAAHGYVARHFGDMTAYRLGRISLNPLRHIDLVGTVVVPLVILVMSKLVGGTGVLFGWAKPVPVNYHALRRPKRDMLWVAAAGPGANLAMALAWMAMLRAVLEMPGSSFYAPLAEMARAGIYVNLILMVLNLLPLLPLDGGRILASLLPGPAAVTFMRLEPLGFPILLVLLVTNLLGTMLLPVIAASLQVMSDISGISIFDLIPMNFLGG
ncbi:MAG: site-2 protease family protein [Gammaproteobacteria bacterium]|nr:site-2 protease family protein [Gammaproteobacteria bacterium]